MQSTEALKAEITTGLDHLPAASLQTLADFVAFLRSKSFWSEDERETEEPEQNEVRRYAEAYRAQPETDEEVAVTYAMSREALAEEPWE